MSLVLACAFPEAAIILSDSRVTSAGKKRDVLRKLYQIGPLLAVGFTSNDVRITERLLGIMTDYVKNHSKSKNTRYLLQRLPKVAKYYYGEFTSKKHQPPMEFVFTGLDTSVGAIISGKALFQLLKRAGSGSVSGRLLYGMKNQKGDRVPLPPPAAIVAKLLLPSGEYLSAAGLGLRFSGTDKQAGEKLMKAFEKAMVVGSNSYVIRHAMISSIIEEHRKKQDIDSIGGLTQAILIDEQGVKPINYEYTKINKDGSEGDKISMKFEKGFWVQRRSRDDKETIVTKCPLLIKSDEVFEANIALDE